MKTSILAVLFTASLFLISSCTVMVGNVEYKQPDKNKITYGCKPFVMPEIKPIPGVPEIPDDIVADRNKTDTILVDKINELRHYAKYVKEQYRNAYEQHMETCQ